MKKPLKYGLIAGSVIVASVAALMILGYNSGRMPTLPTPPGAVVPTGMRYVGGDEFDHTKSAENSMGKLDWNNGILSVQPVWDEASRRGRATLGSWTSVDKVNFDIPGRIEVRMAFHPATDAIASIGTTTALGWFAVKSESTPMETWNTFVSRKYDGGFHTYALAWDSAGFQFLRDGAVEPVPELYAKFLLSETAAPVIPDWIRKRMPGGLANFTDRWRTTYEDAKHTQVMLMVVSQNPDAGIPRADIDYVRIFQE